MNLKTKVTELDGFLLIYRIVGLLMFVGGIISKDWFLFIGGILWNFDSIEIVHYNGKEYKHN